MNVMFIAVPILIGIGFILLFGIMFATIIKGIKEWNKNNHSPRLTVPATVVAKRTDVTHYHSHDNMYSSYTNYYVTFQVESGDRMELHVKDFQYGLMAEEDTGNLSFQGTRFLEFNRNV